MKSEEKIIMHDMCNRLKKNKVSLFCGCLSISKDMISNNDEKYKNFFKLLDELIYLRENYESESIKFDQDMNKKMTSDEINNSLDKTRNMLLNFCGCDDMYKEFFINIILGMVTDTDIVSMGYVSKDKIRNMLLNFCGCDDMYKEFFINIILGMVTDIVSMGYVSKDKER